MIIWAFFVAWNVIVVLLVVMDPFERTRVESQPMAELIYCLAADAFNCQCGHNYVTHFWVPAMKSSPRCDDCYCKEFIGKEWCYMEVRSPFHG